MSVNTTRDSRNPTVSESPNMIQVSALPDLLHVIALTGNRRNCLLKIRHKHETSIHKNHIEIHRAELRTLPLVSYCIDIFSKCPFLSSPTDCIRTLAPQHPVKPALP